MMRTASVQEQLQMLENDTFWKAPANVGVTYRIRKINGRAVADFQ
eukprot:gene6941-4335_t